MTAQGLPAVAASPRLKVCSLCGEALPITAFHRRGHHVRSGVRAACRSCTSKRAKTIRDAQKAQKTFESEARQKAAVRRATRAAVEAGLLKPEPCKACGAQQVEAHHPRYDGVDPHLEVKWLCRSCHALEHGVRDWTKQLPLPIK